jgi:hypothetical protein
MAPATSKRLPIYNCPSDNPSGTFTPGWGIGSTGGAGTYARSNFVFCFGNDFMGTTNSQKIGALRYNSSSSYASMSIDGVSNTILASEIVSGKTTSDRSGLWGLGDAGACGFTCKFQPTNTPVAPTGAVDSTTTGFDAAHAAASSNHPGLVNVCFADNHMDAVATSISLTIWQAYGTVNGGESVVAE